MNRFRQGDSPVERRIGLAEAVDDFDFVAGEQATLLQCLETGGGFGAVTQFHFDSLLRGFQENQFTLFIIEPISALDYAKSNGASGRADCEDEGYALKFAVRAMGGAQRIERHGIL